MITLVLLATSANAAKVLTSAKRVISVAQQTGVTINSYVTNIAVLARPGADTQLLGITLPSANIQVMDLDIAPALTFSLAVMNKSHHSDYILIIRDVDHAAHPALSAVLNSASAFSGKSLFVIKPSHTFPICERFSCDRNGMFTSTLGAYNERIKN